MCYGSTPVVIGLFCVADDSAVGDVVVVAGSPLGGCVVVSGGVVVTGGSGCSDVVPDGLVAGG